MNKAEIYRKLEALERLAARAGTPYEAQAAQARIKEIRERYGIKGPIRRSRRVVCSPNTVGDVVADVMQEVLLRTAYESLKVMQILLKSIS